MKLYSLSKAERIQRNYHFRKVYSQGNKIVGRYFVIFWMESENPRRRLGVSASRKTGNAVERNRAKRLLREVFRRNKYCLNPGIDLVAIARKGLKEQSYKTLEPLFIDALKRIEESRSKLLQPEKSTDEARAKSLS